MINYLCLHDGNSTRVFCEYPNVCPICNKSITPDNKMDYYNLQSKIVYFFFYCPACGECFISSYNFLNKSVTYKMNEYRELALKNSYPCIPNKINFDKCIESLSPSFCEIYNQAHASEIYKLSQISGIGYRKALEFLIKDYCCYRNQNDTKKIKAQLLGQVIDNYVDSNKLRKLSKAAIWLGNDETHYIRKFEDKDINDLKRFITATVAFITYELTSDEASDLVDSK